MLKDKQNNFSKSLSKFNRYLVSDDNKNKSGMNLTIVQGFLYSIASSPCNFTPNEWVYAIFNGIPEFKSVEQQKEVFTALIELYNFVVRKLSTPGENKLQIWDKTGKAIKDIYSVDNAILADFCLGYIQGYLLDPVREKNFAALKDYSLAFFISVVKMFSKAYSKVKVSERVHRKNKQHKDELDEKNLDSLVRKTLPLVLADNYMDWLPMRNLGLTTAYFE